MMMFARDACQDRNGLQIKLSELTKQSLQSTVFVGMFIQKLRENFACDVVDKIIKTAATEAWKALGSGKFIVHNANGFLSCDKWSDHPPVRPKDISQQTLKKK